jgi:hypothetical protein
MSGWYGLLNITREAQQLAEDERSREPTACPIDGEPLERGSDGTLHCRWGNFTA